jgi:hypothetical protein
VRGHTGDELLRLPVGLRGIQLGRSVDLLLHPTEAQGLGVDVLCGDETHRFLPFSAASLGDETLEVQSPFVLLDLPPDSFYRIEARSLSGLPRWPRPDASVLQDRLRGPTRALGAHLLDR